MLPCLNTLPFVSEIIPQMLCFVFIPYNFHGVLSHMISSLHSVYVSVCVCVAFLSKNQARLMVDTISNFIFLYSLEQDEYFAKSYFEFYLQE